MSDANRGQIGGTHYKRMKIEPWDFIIANNIPYLEGNAIKYIARWREKGGLRDIDKAIHYLQKLKEVSHAEPDKVDIMDIDYINLKHQDNPSFNHNYRPQANPSPKHAHVPPPQDAIHRYGQQAMWGTMQDEDNNVLNPEENGGW